MRAIGRCAIGGGVLAVILWTTACDTAPPAGREPQPESSPPAAPGDEPLAAPGERTPPIAESPPVAPPRTTPPVVPPPEPGATQPTAEPELPEYITVLERFERDQAYDVRATTEPGNRLVIDTRNVRRIRIERRALPLAANRSIVLQLDAQGIQWLADSPVVEFERSINGAWSPVKEAAPPRPPR